MNMPEYDEAGGGPIPNPAGPGAPDLAGAGGGILSSLTSSPMLLIAVGVAVWYFFFRKKG